MSLPTVAVTFTAYDQGGQPVAGARVLAKLDQTEIYQGFVVPEQVEVVADAQGRVILNLWPNALGAAGSKYRVRAWSPETGAKFLDTTISVPNTASSLEQILVQEPYPPTDASGQSYSNPDLGQFYAAKFAEKLDRLAVKGVTGQQNSPKRSHARFF